MFEPDMMETLSTLGLQAQQYQQLLSDARERETVAAQRIMQLEAFNQDQAYEITATAARVSDLNEACRAQVDRIGILTSEIQSLKLAQIVARLDTTQTPTGSNVVLSNAAAYDLRQRQRRIEAARMHSVGFTVLPRKDSKVCDPFAGHIVQDHKAHEAHGWRSTKRMALIDLGKAEWRVTSVLVPSAESEEADGEEDDPMADQDGSESHGMPDTSSFDMSADDQLFCDSHGLGSSEGTHNTFDPARMIDRAGIFASTPQSSAAAVAVYRNKWTRDRASRRQRAKLRMLLNTTDPLSIAAASMSATRAYSRGSYAPWRHVSKADPRADQGPWWVRSIERACTVEHDDVSPHKSGAPSRSLFDE
ncbi:hypothetical protein LTR53_011911 [Teratosphaeriaceae sp. CCFEE 6253]|nr:hypothetical protein LTR53_011911 [Teratosphaeriaceae sp. CCFEE 6253]